MIVKFRVVRKDTKAVIVGAKIVLEHGETDGITNSAGEAEIVIFWSGNMMYSVEATGYSKISGTVQVPGSGTITLVVELGAFAQPTTPPPSGEESVRRIQNSCTLVRTYMVGSMWYGVRHDQRGLITAWNRDWEYVTRLSHVQSWCAETALPPPKTAEDVQKDVDILRSALQSITGSITAITLAIEDIRKLLEAIEARIKAWVTIQISNALAPIQTSISNIPGMIATRINAAIVPMQSWMNETQKQVNGIENQLAALKLPDIEPLKAWISDSVFDLLMKKLDEGARQVGRK